MITQPPLPLVELEEAPALKAPIVIARSSDPGTSHLAAARLAKKPKHTTRSMLVAAEILERWGDQSDFGIRAHWRDAWGGDDWSFTLPSKARHWARLAGLIKFSGVWEKNPGSSYTVMVWTLGRDDDYLAGLDDPERPRPPKKVKAKT